MGVRNLMRAAFVGAGAVTLASSPATAQLVTFSTSGAFADGPCTGSYCAFGGLVLEWSGVNLSSWLPPSDVLLGDFVATCYSAHQLNRTPCDPSGFSGFSFTLTISQNGPTPGSGSLSGGLGWNPNTGILSWTPDQGSVTIGGVTYGLTEDGTNCPVTDAGCINISTPHVNYVPTYTDVKDDLTTGGVATNDVTTTPEPATVALMATGMVGLVPLVRRRRKKN